MRIFFVAFFFVFVLGCSSSTSVSPSTTVDPRLVESEPIVDYGVSTAEIRIGSSIFLGEESESTVLQDGFKAYLDAINSQGGMAGRSYEVRWLDTTGDALTHLQNIRELGAEDDAGVAMVVLLEDHSFSLIAEPALIRSQMSGVTMATEEQWSDPQSNIQNVTATCATEKEFVEAFNASNISSEDKNKFLLGWTQAKFVDAVFLAAAKKGDLTRPALAAMAAAYDQSALCKS